MKQEMKIKEKDLVSVKPGVCPGGRFCEEVEYVGIQLIWGEYRETVRVRGLPYLESELTLELSWIE